MVKAKDVMTKDILTVFDTTPIEMVIKVLAIRKMSGFPVVDENKNLVGMISEKDVMGLLLEDKIIEGKTAKDFMTHKVEVFDIEDNLNNICKFLLEKPFRRVPIIDKGKLAGIISRGDIIAYIWKEKLKEKK